MKTLRVLLAAGFVAVVGVACGGGDGGGSAEASGGGGGGGGGGGSVTLTASNFAFQPTSLSVSAGDTIEFTNEDDAAHTFTVKKADINEEVEAGASTSVSVEGVDAGNYDFFCEFHPSMKGTLEVTG